MTDFSMLERIALHDSTLVSVQFIWTEGTCKVALGRGDLPGCLLSFSGVSNLTMSRTLPWGPSRSINSITRISNSRFEIEMQSGDLIQMDASGVSVTIEED